MLNFQSALNQGLKAAHETARLRQEIKDVFQKLNEDVLATTQGKVGIGIQPWNPYGSVNRLAAFLLPEALVVYSTSNVDLKEKLADWEESVDGYPCTMSIGREQIICNDQIALIEILEKLLAESSTGQKILSLMNAEIAS